MAGARVATSRSSPSARAARPMRCSCTRSGCRARGCATTSSRAPSPSTLRTRLKQVERELAPLEKQRAALAEKLAATTDHRELATLGAELAALGERIGVLEEQWLELGTQLEA